MGCDNTKQLYKFLEIIQNKRMHLFSRISVTAETASIPCSIRAKATKTGALQKCKMDVTQNYQQL